MIFSIEIEREEDGRWLAEVPTLAGVMCYGADRDEAVARVQAGDRGEHTELGPLEQLAVNQGAPRPGRFNEDRLANLSGSRARTEL